MNENVQQSSIGHFSRGNSLNKIINQNTGIVFSAHESYRKAYNAAGQFCGHNVKIFYEIFYNNRPHIQTTVFAQNNYHSITTDMVFQMFGDTDYVNTDTMTLHFDTIAYLQVIDKHYKTVTAPMYIAALMNSVLGSGMMDYFTEVIYHRSKLKYNFKTIERLFDTTHINTKINGVPVKEIFCKNRRHAC